MPTIEELKSQFGNNARLLKRTVGAFLRTWPKELEELQDSLKENDLERAGRSAHRLKGSLGYFAPADMLNMAVELEEATGQGDQLLAQALAADLGSSLNGLNGELEAMLESLEGGD